jgi:hypothetical protein
VGETGEILCFRSQLGHSPVLPTAWGSVSVSIFSEFPIFGYRFLILMALASPNDLADVSRAGDGGSCAYAARKCQQTASSCRVVGIKDISKRLGIVTRQT